MTPLLELQDVSLSFGAQHVLHTVSLQVVEGESLVIVGPSGHGKTCLLKLLGGLLPASNGQVIWEGRPLNNYTTTERDRWLKKVGFLFQKNALFDSMTVDENVRFSLEETTSLTEAEIHQRVDQYLESVSLGHAKALYPNEISGGMQKRLGIARALALHPRVILYDDPTAGLDPITSRKIIQLVLDLKDQLHATIVTVTNDMSRAYQLAGRIAVVIDGELIVAGNREQTLSHPDPRVQQFIRGAVNGPLAVMA